MQFWYDYFSHVYHRIYKVKYDNALDCLSNSVIGGVDGWGRGRQQEVRWESLTDTNRRQEGKEVVLLVVNDIPGVPLLPLLWVAEPHRTGTEVTHTATSRPGAAPEEERR